MRETRKVLSLPISKLHIVAPHAHLDSFWPQPRTDLTDWLVTWYYSYNHNQITTTAAASADVFGDKSESLKRNPN